MQTRVCTPTYLPLAIRIAALFTGLICCCHGLADGGGAIILSDEDVTGGVVVKTEASEITIAERSGEQRTFSSCGRSRVTIDGRKADVYDIKVGMTVQVVFFRKADGRKVRDWLPFLSIKGVTRQEKPTSLQTRRYLQYGCHFRSERQSEAA
jgi:hypothetical protein